jgi:hypothetical protein
MNDGKQNYPSKTETPSQGEDVGISATTSVHDSGQLSELPRGSDEIVAETKKTISLKKLASNRRNSLKSTGPRTPDGKRRVSRNAIRHGFYSKWLLVRHADGKEDESEYDDSYAAIYKHYQPLGWLEERCVETIAVWSWRLRRVIRYETGQIARALAQRRYDIHQSTAVNSEEPQFLPPGGAETEGMADHLFLTSDGLENQMRYEALIGRHLNRSISELERLQARRKGDFSLSAEQSQEAL